MIEATLYLAALALFAATWRRERQRARERSGYTTSQGLATLARADGREAPVKDCNREEKSNAYPMDATRGERHHG